MNKRRLLLFSVFALLHITTSERNFIDGSYRCCNYSSRYLSSNTVSVPHRVQRLLSEIRTLNTPEKNPNFIVRDSELNQLIKHQQVRLIEPRSRGDESRRTFGKYRNRILNTHSPDILRRRNFKERIDVYRTDLQNNVYHNRFDGSSSCYNNIENEVSRNRFEDKRESRFNHEDHDADSLGIRDNRNGIKRNLLAHVVRDSQRYATRDSVRDHSDYSRYTERKIIPQKLVLDRNVDRKSNLQNIRRIRTDRAVILNQFDNERFTRLNTYRNLDIELSRRELLRKTFISRDEESNNRINFKYNNRVSIMNNEINRRLLIRDTYYLNSLTQNRKRSERVYNREVNEIDRGTPILMLELHEAARLRDYVKNRHEVASRIQYDRQNVDRLEVHRERENRQNHRRTTSKEKYTARYILNNNEIQFDRIYENYNVRNNRDMKERVISEDKNGRINVKPDIKGKNMNFKEANKRVNIFESRINNRDRYYKNNDVRNINQNKLSVLRSYIGRFLERYNKRTTRYNLSTEHFHVREELRRPRIIQRITDNSSDRILRHNRLTSNVTPEVSEKDEVRRKLTDSRFLNDNIMSRRRQSNRRYINDNKTPNIKNVRRSLENRLNLRIVQNTSTSRSNRQVETLRGTRITRTGIEDVFYQRLYSVSNEKRSTNNRQVTRKVNDERGHTKQSQEDRSINIRQIDTTNEKRYSMTEFFDNKGSRTQKIQYGNNIFGINWQYLFYALQFVYLCSIIIQIPKNHEEKKQNRWVTYSNH
ncbi:unnamed protein product [Euphydryas editha]|uniref:Uncharacterized protein n=1 Tax=Euphydryas editha TaxID=104508 RepID=A0AAU9U5A0_EUPED|nr:unnamed protein product [Euphydryas editha]